MPCCRLTNRWSRRPASSFCLILALLTLIVIAPVFAGVTYQYDALGRLVRVVDETGQVTTYQYDAVGNLLAVTQTGTQPPPVITGIVPSSARAGETVEVAITGQNLLGAMLSTTYVGLTMTNVTAAATQITAIFALAETAPPGQATIQATTASGAASVGFTILPPPQTPILSPTYLALAPGQTATVTISIAQSDPDSTTIRLETADPGIAAVSPPEVIIPAGQTSRSATVTAGPVLATTTLTARAGTKTATATIEIFGPITWASAQVSVALSPLPPTVDKNVTASVSVALTPAPSTADKNVAASVSVALTPAPTTADKNVAASVSVALAPVVTSVSPASAARGTANLAITIVGSGFTGASALSFLFNNANDANITVSNLVVNAEGTQATANISIAAGAATGARVVRITTPAGSSTAAGTGGNLFTVQ